MNICFVSDSYPLTPPFGGIATYSRTAAQELSGRGHEVHVVVGWRGETGDIMDGLVQVHYRKVRWLPVVGNMLPGLGESLSLAVAIRDLHRRYHFDLVEFPNFEGHGLVCQAFASIPVVIRLHTSMVESIEVEHRESTFGERFMKWAERQSARWAQGVVTHSTPHRDRLARIYGLPEIQIIKHGIHLPAARTRDACPRAILSIGHLSARKGGATLLAVIARVHEQVPDAIFTLVGATEEEPAMRRFREAYPSVPRASVVCRGFVNQAELDALYEATAVYVSASVYESFGLTFVEAMARGIPVVGCAVSAMNEVIDHEVTGILVPPGDTEAMAAAIVRLLRDAPLRARLEETGQRVAIEKYSAERMGVEIEAWYEEVLGKLRTTRREFLRTSGDNSPAVLPETKLFKKVVYRLGGSLVRPIYGGLGSVLVLHRVVPEAERSPFPGNRALEITPEDLRTILAWVRRCGIEPITLDEVPARLRTPRRPRFIVFTLDDGYRDNLVHARSVFREFQTPFAVNVVNGFASGSESIWWYFLEEALSAKSSLRFTWKGSVHEFGCATGGARNLALENLSKVIRGLGTARNELLQRIAEAAEIDPLACTRKLAMTWDEVRELAAEPLATIGAHGACHHSLNRLTANEIVAEVHAAKHDLEKQTGRDIRHFAYAFGGANAVDEREFEIVRRAGFTTMVTTRPANLIAEDAGHLDRLPRSGISGNYAAEQSIVMIESGLNSLLGQLTQKRRMPSPDQPHTGAIPV